MRILVTGASGFIGTHLTKLLLHYGHEVVAVVRDSVGLNSEHVFDIGAEHNSADWARLLRGVDVIVHLAGVAHTKLNNAQSAEAHFRRVNVAVSERVMIEGSKAGIRHFVYLSSTKAAGDTCPLTENGDPIPLSTEQAAKPTDHYGKSKLAAEQRLSEIAREFKVKLTVLRPPLVYGVGQKGNLKTLYRIVLRGIPMPLASVNNQRSLISVNNLCDAISSVIADSKKLQGTYFVSDFDISTPGLIRAIAESLNQSPRLFPFPVSILRAGGQLFGETQAINSLINSLVVDSRPFSERFRWQPKVSFSHVMKEIARSDFS